MPSIGQHIIDRLKGVGVDHAFGVPGDYNLNFYDKLQKSKIGLIGTTNEANAGLAADAYARVHGIGCVCVTYCVGGFSLVNAIAGAYAEKSPVVVVSGAPGIKERDSDLLLHHMVKEFECQHKVFSNITCANTVLRDPALAGYEIDRVLEACRYYKQPVYIELPRDMVDVPVEYDPWSVGTPPSAVITDEINLEEALAETIEWLNKADNPVILAGVEVARYGFGKQLMKFAENCNIPMATTLLGKSVVNEHHPLSLGVYLGGADDHYTTKFVDNSDCILMLGVLMTDVNVGFMPKKVMRRNVILSTCQDMHVRNHNYKKVNFADFFTALTKRKLNRRQMPSLEKPESKPYVVEPAKKVTMERLFHKIGTILTDDMAIIADVGNAMFGAADIPVNCNHFVCPAFYTSMGNSVPGALGVQTADPKVRPIVVVGDGAFQMTGQEFSTIVRRGLNPIVFVLNNAGYTTERFIKDGPYNDIQVWNYEAIPQLVGGGQGRRVETEAELESAIKEALSSKVAFVINVILDKKDASPGLKRMITAFGKKGGL